MFCVAHNSTQCVTLCVCVCSKAKLEKQKKKRNKSVILCDEVDQMIVKIPGFLRSLTSVLRTARRPIVLTANGDWFADALDVSSHVFAHVSSKRLALRLHIIGLCEGVWLSQKQLCAILTTFDNDFRRVLNHMQFWLNHERNWHILKPHGLYCIHICLRFCLLFLFCYALCAWKLNIWCNKPNQK